MIPADNFLLSDDGTTALWVNDAPGAANTTTLNRPCETTYDDLQERFGDPYVRCPDCDGTGRHTFNIEVECGHFDDPESPTISCWNCEAGKRTYRVHVIDVLPIVDTTGLHQGEQLPPPDHACAISTYSPRVFNVGSKAAGWEPITLPPDAAPGQWLVRLAVH